MRPAIRGADQVGAPLTIKSGGLYTLFVTRCLTVERLLWLRGTRSLTDAVEVAFEDRE